MFNHNLMMKLCHKKVLIGKIVSYAAMKAVLALSALMDVAKNVEKFLKNDRCL